MDPTRPSPAFDDSEFDDPHFESRYGSGPPTSEDRILALISHLSPLVGAGVIAPLVIYLVKKDTSAFAADQAKEALNFHITVMLALVVSGILAVVVIGLFMIFAVLAVACVLAILAAIKANDGEMYRYPYTLRLVK